ncbi:leucine-rich repeat domain-containing protein [Leptospira koniambonensis]|uniref:Leucine-rich repeat domain-containing protein n=1 Tax=Leptospira koniambonensis TaxID=2484950 RepID=A0A4R9J7N1_9LEPT|nr:leucine-rich repeat domain-containing protein [Leptospira koniambonensis]TGL34766.1 leucine-rich repeat domain-containing protein [Leptospira koniambonensis]
MNSKTLLVSVLLLSVFTFFDSNAESEKPEFYKISYQDLTENSTVFQIPFDFVVPKDYSLVSEPRSVLTQYVIHNEDIDSINLNGGVIDESKLNYPMYSIEPSTLFFYAKQKFYGEDERDGLKKTRIDTKGFPVLTIQGENKRKDSFNLILIHPNSGNWVIFLNFIPSKKQPEISQVLWENLIQGIKGEKSDLTFSSIPKRKFVPTYPDSKEFSKDVYYNQYVQPMNFPDIFPEPGKTSEAELYQMNPETSIIRRYTLSKPIIWTKGKKEVKFDCFIEYRIKEKSETFQAPGMQGFRRLETFRYSVFLYKGTVIEFDLVHKIDKSKNEEIFGPKNKTIEETKGDFEHLRISYLRERSPSFRKTQGGVRFYEDYLELSEVEKNEITELELKYLTEFPIELFKFKNLKSLTLAGNGLTEMDCKSIEGLKSLETLNLSKNKFNTVPECLLQLQSLKKLNLSYNPLKTIPSSVLKLDSIIELDLNDAQISEISDRVPNWSRLTHLYLSGNRIKRFPLSWGNLKSLSYIDLNENRLKKPPEYLSNIKNLEYISLEENEISEFPSELLSLNKLIRLDLAQNKITFLPETLCGKRKNPYPPTIYVGENPINKSNFKKIKSCSKSYGIYPNELN